MEMSQLALIGNPNSGKTTLFNALTGSNQHIGNWPGVTVERKSGVLKHNKNMVVQDLPGIYSLSPYSSEEMITRKYLLDELPDQTLDVVDSTNLERNLYLTLQLMETGIPLLLILNMMDILKKQHHRRINLKKLSYILDVPVVSISALKKQNLDQLTEKIEARDAEEHHYAFPEYDYRLESALSMIQEQLKGLIPDNELRWYSIKVFERDEAVTATLDLTE